MDERRFILASTMAITTLIVVLGTAVTTQAGMWLAMSDILAILIIMLLTRYTIRSKKYTLGGSLLVLLAHFFIVPAGYITGGGVHSGAPLWLILGGVIVFVLFRGRMLVPFSITAFLSVAGSIYIESIHPEWIVPIAKNVTEKGDTLLSVVLVTAIIGTVYVIQSRVLEHEIKNAQEQSK